MKRVEANNIKSEPAKTPVSPKKAFTILGRPLRSLRVWKRKNISRFCKSPIRGKSKLVMIRGDV